MTHGLMLALALIGANGESREKLVEAIAEFGQSHLAKALSLLDEAEQKTSEPKVLSKIYRQRGIIFEVQQQRLEAIVAFNTALWLDSDLELSGSEHRGQVASLFACAKSLFEAGEREVSIRSRYGSELQGTDWRCPVRNEAETPPPDIEDPPAPPPPDITAETTPPEEGGIGIPFWIAAGAAVAAAGAGAGLGATATSRANDGDAATDPRGMATGATVSFGVAGAAAATAVVLLIIDLM